KIRQAEAENSVDVPASPLYKDLARSILRRRSSKGRASMAAPITFVVAGASESRDITAAARGGPALSPLPAGLARGTVKQSVRVAAQRGGASEVRVKAQP